MDPIVTVYVPVYNGARYLREALGSIAAQTYPHWECIVVDDCSTDESPEIIASFTDPRFRVVRQPVNMHVANASNLALRLARGRYLARLDQDDIAHPERLALQVDVMENDPGIAVCGSWMEVFGGKEGGYFVPAEDGRIKANLLSGMNTISNPSSMVRTAFLQGNNIQNDPRFPLSCDYVMWVDCTLAGARFVNVQKFLARYRWHDAQGSRDMEELVKGVISSKTRLLCAWFPDFTYSEIVDVEPLLRANGYVVLSPEHVHRGLALCRRMSDPARTSVSGEDREAVRQYLAERMREWGAHVEKG